MEQGLSFYENHLKPVLEPTHDGEAIALHVETGAYALARYTGAALRLLRKTHPTGEALLFRVGSRPDFGLAARANAGTAVTK